MFMQLRIVIIQDIIYYLIKSSNLYRSILLDHTFFILWHLKGFLPYCALFFPKNPKPDQVPPFKYFFLYITSIKLHSVHILKFYLFK